MRKAEWRVVANACCSLRCPVPSFETCVPGAGQPHPVTGQEEAREERRNGLKQPGATTRPIATVDGLRLRGWKRNNFLSPTRPTLRYLPTRGPVGVFLFHRRPLGLNLTAGRGYGECGPTLLFHARPDGHHQICVQGGYVIFPKWMMLRICIPRH